MTFADQINAFFTSPSSRTKLITLRTYAHPTNPPTDHFLALTYRRPPSAPGSHPPSYRPVIASTNPNPEDIDHDLERPVRLLLAIWSRCLYAARP